jgi:hypothetical protein
MHVASVLRRWWGDIVAAGIVAAVLAVLLWFEVRPFVRQPGARRELVAFASELKLGMSRTDVTARLTPARQVLLTSTDVGPTEILVETPYTFGAGSWLAWMAFADGRLSSIRIRTHDGRHIKPAGSPPDVEGAPATSPRSP